MQCHFKIEGNFDLPADPFQIVVLNVPAVFSEVEGDLIGTAQNCFKGSGSGIRMKTAASLPHSSHMIDINA